jgi:hypothetical protein
MPWISRATAIKPGSQKIGSTMTNVKGANVRYWPKADICWPLRQTFRCAKLIQHDALS